ncbi:MAG: FKBP-type peptidyl-prolyl cis-trans isomerase [Gammaproteobacteria bacterium]|nr:FKBP-type peptidyl-prolyl cis-trans isomerase [Gammaproteobacteria bacterium]
MKNYLSIIFLVAILGMLAACSNKENETAAALNLSSVTQLKIIDSLEGDGKKVKNNHRVAVHYTGWLYDEAAVDKKGKKFDSSYDRSRPFVFSIGNKDVIAGWEQGLMGMKVGGKRTLIIPPELGYGAKGAGSSIPPNAALIFDIDLLQAGA